MSVAAPPARLLAAYEQSIHLPNAGMFNRLLNVVPATLLRRRPADTIDRSARCVAEASGDEGNAAVGKSPGSSASENLVGLDPLTGLVGPGAFHRRASEIFGDIDRDPSARAAGLLIGLDGFGRVNDALGREAGDRVLVELAGRLETAAGPAASVARIGGDVFAVLAPECAGSGQVQELAQRLLAAVATPVAVDGLEVVVTASAGAVLLPEHAGDPATSQQRGELALHEAKAAGGDRMLVYSPEWGATARQDFALEQDLRKECRGGVTPCGLRLHYQPVVALSTLRVVGAEALVRWQHPRRGLLAPATFIPAAERSGLVLPLGAWVLRTAVGWASHWRARERGDLVVGVNASARQLVEGDFSGLVAEALEDAELPADALEIEVTESAAMLDLDRAVATLRALRELGVRIALDDFGTGYSSLAHLRRLPIDTLKVDRSFVAGLPGDRAARATVAAVVELARAQGLTVVAEGVETEDELEVVRDLGCDAAQGYLFGAPLPADEFEDLVGEAGRCELEVEQPAADAWWECKRQKASAW